DLYFCVRMIQRPGHSWRNWPATLFTPCIIAGDGMSCGVAYWKSRRSTHTSIDLPLFINELKHRLGRSRRFSLTEKQITTRLVQRIREKIEHRLLQVRLQVDEKISARHQIDARKRNAAANVLLSKNNHLPECFRNAVAMIGTFKVPVAVIVR